MSALTIVTSKASGSSNTFAIPFPYLHVSHCHVFVNDVETTSFTWNSEGLITISGALLPAGTSVRRQRITPDEPIVNFKPGNLGSVDLNVASLQPIFMAQEAKDRLNLTELDIANLEINLALETEHRKAEDERLEGMITAIVGGEWSAFIGEIVSPKMYGAKGDGITDDTLAIQKANDTGKTVIFTDGVYCATKLNMTVGWHMLPNAKLLYIGEQRGIFVTCAASNLNCGDITIDGNNLEPLRLLYVSGNRNRFKTISLSRMVSTNQTWVNTSMYVNGMYNKFALILVEDLVSQGQDNHSSPQGVTLSAPAQGNVFHDIYGKNIRSTMVDNSQSYNQFGTISSVDCRDNGAYFVGPGSKASVGTILYEGDDNAIGFRHGASPTIGQVLIQRSGATSLFFGDCGDVTIGDIIVTDNNNPILHLNNANTGHIKINSIKGKLRNSAVIAMPADFGSVKYLTIGSLDVQTHLDAGYTGSTRSICRIDAAKGINLGDIKFDVYLEGYVPTTPFYFVLNPALEYPSFIDRLRFAVWEADQVTPSTGQGAFVQYAGGQEKLRLAEGVLNNINYLRPYSWGAFQVNRLVAQAIPTAGYWRRGELLWSDVPTAALRGWVCTASGTPGTWAPF